MSYRKSIVGILPAVTCALAGAALLAPSASAAEASSSTVPFSANSKNCNWGHTEGTLTWPDKPTADPHVDVAGYVSDQTRPTWCAIDDSRYTVASFTAYSNAGVVDKQTWKVDNGRLDFRFWLANKKGDAPVDTVVVRICRFTKIGPIGLPICGTPQKYGRP